MVTSNKLLLHPVIMFVHLQLLQKAAELQAIRGAYEEPKTGREHQVKHMVGYLHTQMIKIPEANWGDFTIDLMRLIQHHQMHRPATYQQHTVQQQQQQPVYEQHLQQQQRKPFQ